MLQTGVASVTVTTPGSGYTSVPSVSFAAAPGSGTTATGTAVMDGIVSSVTITNPGTGYTAAAAARLTRGGNSPQENLFWARHSLYGKQLIVKIVDE